MAATLLLDRAGWDLCLTANGDIAVATEPYAQEQDVASECRVFEGECYYDTTRGIPYLTSILGRPVPVQILKEKLAEAARRVPGVRTATVYLTDITARSISGQVQFTAGQSATGTTIL
jgi:hypothetical protein